MYMKKVHHEQKVIYACSKESSNILVTVSFYFCFIRIMMCIIIYNIFQCIFLSLFTFLYLYLFFMVFWSTFLDMPPHGKRQRQSSSLKRNHFYLLSSLNYWKTFNILVIFGQNAEQTSCTATSSNC